MVTKSTSVSSARIPKKINVFIKPFDKYKVVTWSGSRIELPDSFICSYDSPKETAWKWATNYGKIKKEDVIVEELNNEEVESVQLIRLDERGEGGRAWKVIYKEYIVDLREEPFCDAIFRNGVQTNSVGTFVKGPFVWAVEGSQNKLIVVGSSLYNSIKEYEKERQKETGKTLEQLESDRFRKHDLETFKKEAFDFFYKKLIELRTAPNELSESFEKVKEKVVNDLDYIFHYYNENRIKSFKIFSGLSDEWGYENKKRTLHNWGSVRSKLNDDKTYEMIVGLSFTKKNGPKLQISKYNFRTGYSDYDIIVEKIPMFKIKMTSDKQFSVESI